MTMTSPEPAGKPPEAHCSFCGKTQAQVRKLIAAPGVYICDLCIDLCCDILDEEFAQEERIRQPITDVIAKHTADIAAIAKAVLALWGGPAESLPAMAALAAIVGVAEANADPAP